MSAGVTCDVSQARLRSGSQRCRTPIDSAANRIIKAIRSFISSRRSPTRDSGASHDPRASTFPTPKSLSDLTTGTDAHVKVFPDISSEEKYELCNQDVRPNFPILHTRAGDLVSAPGHATHSAIHVRVNYRNCD